jgi:ATP-dependent NAD(P)H-hydrate dehydratase
VPIKCYSPELIVHPILAKNKPEDITSWFDSLHSLVVGPGLGRTKDFLDELTVLIEEALKKGKLE